MTRTDYIVYILCISAADHGTIVMICESEYVVVVPTTTTAREINRSDCIIKIYTHNIYDIYSLAIRALPSVARNRLGKRKNKNK